MVNDKMANGFMNKKEYMAPLFEVELLNTAELMSVSSESELPVNPAPARRTKPF